MKKFGALSLFVIISFVGNNPSLVLAGGAQDYNGCKLTGDDPCLRYGSCSIQGTSWEQDVWAYRSDKFDTQGWPGLCDMAHVRLIQGRCNPLGSQTEVRACLGDNCSYTDPEITSYTDIPALIGTLACGGEVADPTAEICNDGIDNDGDGLTDVSDPDCQQGGVCSDITKRNECTNTPGCMWDQPTRTCVDAI